MGVHFEFSSTRECDSPRPIIKRRKGLQLQTVHPRAVLAFQEARDSDFVTKTEQMGREVFPQKVEVSGYVRSAPSSFVPIDFTLSSILGWYHGST